jgi:ADP-ribose pyrophosphatase YjhB (NUDIX family)
MEISAGLLIVQQNRILLGHPTNAPWYGTYTIPKGKVEEDESLIDAAIRETKEETGIDLGLRQFDFKFHYTYRKKGVNKHMDVFVVSMTSDEFSKLEVGQRDKKEIKKVKFVNKEKALDLVENKFKKLIRYIYK